jgi:AcrR family transcriptional regulator
MTAEVVDRQERRKRRTRQAIQKAALELFAERGYRETTINDIAERAEVAPRRNCSSMPNRSRSTA